ncbi:hypothetical protein SD70_29325 [Gordoniibacillus kamchatkensis]|uniref:Terminase n=1 Tax=Gordoniibacillus kamchatkensis TaxID=1590651 RepID=A0ABR5AAT2_9BACL|nr:hypothetical protein [Paenibacillus sp. VKM B-2647]KIL38002.1 hypothetical protein SD70_29325 [Paenibacillus sp. VKM B-2647]
MKDETGQQIEAFDYYYSLGAARSLKQVAQQFGKGFATIKRWSSEFRWRDRVQQRDQELGAQIEAQTNQHILDRHEKKQRIIDHLYDRLYARVMAGGMEVSTMADFERLAKIEQTVMIGLDEEGGDNIRSLADILQQSAELIKAATGDSDVRQ